MDSRRQRRDLALSVLFPQWYRYFRHVHLVALAKKSYYLVCRPNRKNRAGELLVNALNQRAYAMPAYAWAQ
jgi:hypothetical protein